MHCWNCSLNYDWAKYQRAAVVYDDINTPEKSLDFMQPIGSLQRVGEFGFGTTETR